MDSGESDERQVRRAHGSDLRISAVHPAATLVQQEE